MEKYKEGFDMARNFISSLFNFIVSFVDAIIYIILITGAISSFILLMLLFPEIFIKAFTPFFIVFKIMWLIITFLIYVLLGSCLAYLILKVTIPLIGLSKKRREQRRDEFINELAIKMKKKTKN